MKARPTPALRALNEKVSGTFCRNGPKGASHKRFLTPFRPRRRRRAGVSLLEVLISIFVLTVGLLGIAAIIPVGGHEIAQAAKADRAGACGHHGLQEVKIREVLSAVDGTRCGMLDPDSWLDVFWENASPVGDWTVAVLPTLSVSHSYAIDPLFVAQNPANTSTDPDRRGRIRRFPYAPPGYDFAAPDAQWYNRPLTMQRVTLNQIQGTFDNTIPILTKINWQRGVSERLFTWRDDLDIAVPGDTSLRARQMMLCDTGRGEAVPELPGDPAPGNPLVAEIDGNYTWLATVTPQSSQVCSVSIVVFYKRDFSPPWDPAETDRPGERTCVANLIGGGLGGGDVVLTVSDAAHARYLEVKEGEWLMLCGRDEDTDPNLNLDVFKWYRIVAAAQIDPEAPLQRYVTLAGPDWNCGNPGDATDYGWCTGVDSDGDGVVYEAQAALFDGVVGVYTTTVELD